MTSERY